MINFLALCIFISVSAKANYVPQTIYGTDDRYEAYEIKNQGLKKIVKAVAAEFNKANLKKTKLGNYEVKIKNTYGDGYNLCKGEKYFDQPIAPECTGFLVTPEILVTAGHCAKAKSCPNRYWVFGFHMKNETTPVTEFTEDQVYKCKKVLKSVDKDNEDWAVIQLDRPVVGIEPLAIKRESEVAKGSPIMSLGYPMGLPLKVSLDGMVRNWSNKGDYFIVSVDVASGNSGSPIIDPYTREVEGILVRGEDDLEDGDKCMKVKKCSDYGCDGEEVTNIRFAHDFLRPYLNN